MIKNCNINNCRYPYFHVSKGHLCGNCNKYGHGITECNDSIKIRYINNNYFENELSPHLYCKFGNCQNKYFHMSESHHCELCFERMHSIETCPHNITQPNNIIIICPICRCENSINQSQPIIKGLTDKCVICMDKSVEIYYPKCGHTCVCSECNKRLDKNGNTKEFNIFDDIRNESILIDQYYDIVNIKSKLLEYPSYITIYEGMGCISYIRRLNILSPIEGLFNHSDDGYSPEKTLKINNFITGYLAVDANPIMMHEWKNY